MIDYKASVSSRQAPTEWVTGSSWAHLRNSSASLSSERLDHVHSRRTRRRRDGRDDGGRHEYGRGRGKRDHARHLNTGDEAAGDAREQPSTRDAGDDADDADGGALTEDPGEQVPRCRSHRQAHAELPGARADGERQDAGHAHHRDEQRDARESAEDQCVRAVRRENLRTDVIERRRAFHRLIAHELASPLEAAHEASIIPCELFDHKEITVRIRRQATKGRDRSLTQSKSESCTRGILCGEQVC